MTPFSKGVKLFVAFAKCQAFLPCTGGEYPTFRHSFVVQCVLSIDLVSVFPFSIVTLENQLECSADLFPFSCYSFLYENEVSVFKYAPSQHCSALPPLILCVVP